MSNKKDENRDKCTNLYVRHCMLLVVVSKLLPTTNGLPSFVLMPTLLFDMGIPKRRL